ncbi:MAG TPA: GatB/YqeY domain-containing protein [Rhizomicrobium sp.]|nr:GatB/YqeY domain-containing protein [Rhizomicrobium sp.]
MGLRERINDSVKEAMKAKDARRLGTLRLINAAIKDRDIAARTADSRDLLGDDELLGLLAKMIKQREDSVAAFETGNRPEMAQNERDEIALIREFMPQQMSAEETATAVASVVADLGATSLKDMGKVMAALKERYAGQMDFGKASGAVKTLLTPKLLAASP